MEERVEEKIADGSSEPSAGRQNLASKVKNCLLVCQQRSASQGIMPCLFFCPFLFTMVVAFSCTLEVVKLVFMAAAYDSVVIYASEHHCWDLLSSPKSYYIGIMDLTR